MTDRDQRQAVRVARPLDAQYSQDCTFIAARITDLSEVGLFLETNHPLVSGTEIQLRFDLSTDNDAPIEALGVVVWHEQMVGVGVEFQQLPEETRDRIKSWVAESSASGSETL